MTLWELVSATDHSCDIFGDHDASECPHCLVKQWAREKAKEWELASSPMGEWSAVNVDRILFDLGVPEEEKK